jgi:hypothetical protein
VRPLLACAAALACAAPAVAQPAYLGEVTADGVAVRCGPSDQMPETGQLFRGTRVVVDHEEPNGWLAVQPPRGQVSWINHKFLGPQDGQPADVIPRNAVVHAEPEAELAFGRPGLGKPLDVRRTRVPDQTIVLVIGKKVEHNGSVWYPVEPPDGDFRYVPKSAVRFVRGEPAPGFVVRSPAPAPAADPPPGLDPPPASVPGKPAAPAARGKPADWPNHPLWQQAEQAERAGDYDRAEQLYLKLAGEMNQPGGDAELANLCYTRVHAVREKQRQARPAPDRPPAGQWVGPGVLRPAGFKMDGRTTYAVVGPRGEVKCYAVAGSGVDLERYKGFDVELYGAITYPGDLRGAGVMTATKVQLAR